MPSWVRPETAVCRNRSKLLRLLPDVKEGGKVKVFEGSIQDVDLLRACISGCRAVFLVVSTNDNIPGCRIAQDAAASVIQVLRDLKTGGGAAQTLPKLVLLSSNSLDEHLSQVTPYLIRVILYRSASQVYSDLVAAENLLREEEDWLTTIYMKPGALSVDIQRGHALSFTGEDKPVSYLDLAAGMIEAADDSDGRYDLKNLTVVNTNGSASFPVGTLMCIATGLLRHYFPFLHPYLPSNTGPGGGTPNPRAVGAASG